MPLTRLEDRLMEVRRLLKDARPRLLAGRENGPWAADDPIDPNPVLTETQVAAFECEHGVGLPEDYRGFLLRIGNGGPGPGYGLMPLRSPFDFNEQLHELGIDNPLGHRSACRCVAIASYGCGHEWELIVSGPAAGNVTLFTEFGFEPCDPPCRFLDWYQAWLSDVLGLGGRGQTDLLRSWRHLRQQRHAEPGAAADGGGG